MEKLFMSAGIIVAITMSVIGIVKMPFKGLKEKHPQLYRGIFAGASFVIAIVLSVIDELFILEGEIISWEFATLCCAVVAGVTGGYSAYEGLGFKELMKKLFGKIKELLTMSKSKKVVKYLNNIEDIDEAINILVERKNNQNHEV